MTNFVIRKTALVEGGFFVLSFAYTIRFICIFAPKLRIYSIYWANLLNLLSEITQSN